ncbi:MAG: Cache 3/Cache 2 fusion domain-containing protein [Methyloceanibacter sp.]|uniref:Cache 3/Cache 2 fusion domain-containing protein n=1 Tax=Methyloceanibacter sp. TaxID=1965321 RepID=UPI003D9BF06B
MERRNLILSLFAIGCFIATATLIPGLGTAQADKVKAAMADLKAKTEKLGAAKVEGKDLYFGTTKVDNSVVDAVAKEQGGAATIFVKAGNEYVRVATTVKKEDGTSAVGTALDVKKAAIARLNNGEAYYGDATVFGKSYDAGYEPIKDASGAVIGAYFVGQPY